MEDMQTAMLEIGAIQSGKLPPKKIHQLFIPFWRKKMTGLFEKNSGILRVFLQKLLQVFYTLTFTHNSDDHA